MRSKYFCAKNTHELCDHDWDVNTSRIIKTIDECTLQSDELTKVCMPEQHTTGDEKDQIIIQLLKDLEIAKCHSESFWQKKLVQYLNKNDARMCRSYLKRHHFVTDLSSEHVLIEIKHEKDFRTAVGQIADYNEVLSRQRQNTIWFRYILLFGDRKKWSTELWVDRSRICSRVGIILRWLK